MGTLKQNVCLSGGFIMEHILDFTKTTPKADVKIFLGDYDGVQRYDRYVYDSSERMIKVQQAATWFPREISYTKDKVGVNSLSPTFQQLYRENLLFQTIADSLANRFLDNMLSGMATSPEWEAILKWQAHFELLHSESYSWNIREVFVDPEEFFQEGLKNDNIIHRLDLERETYAKLEQDMATKWYDRLAPEKALVRKKRAIFKAAIQQYILENVRFMVSFLYTLKINHIHDQSLQGSTNSIKLILNDEIIHTVIFANLINILRREKNEGFTDILKEDYDTIVKDMFRDVIASEMDWFYHLDSIQSIDGFTADSIRGFLEEIAYTAMSQIGVEDDSLLSVKNEVSIFFNKNNKINDAKALSQETDLLSYNIASLEDDEFDHKHMSLSFDEIMDILDGKDPEWI